MPGELVKINLSKDIFERNSNIYWKLENYYDNKKFYEKEFIDILEESNIVKEQIQMSHLLRFYLEV